MKKILTGIIALAAFVTLAGCMSAPASAPAAGMDLDAAIKEAAGQMEARLPQGTMIALVSVASPSTAFSTQALTMLESALVNGGELVVVDRANLDKIRAEQGFQLSGEVDDESAKSIGKLLGAGAIVTGGIVDLGDVYSLTLKAINMETATVAVSYLADLAKTTRIETLLVSGGDAGGTASGARPASGGQAAAAPAAPAASTGPKDGTYTFWPRLQAYKGASKDPRAFLWQVIVRGEYMSIYTTRSANGPVTERAVNWADSIALGPSSYLLQDLDNPGRSYRPEGSYHVTGEGIYHPFKGVKAKRFSFSRVWNDTVESTFEEVILGEPDAQ